MIIFNKFEAYPEVKQGYINFSNDILIFLFDGRIFKGIHSKDEDEYYIYVEDGYLKHIEFNLVKGWCYL